MATQKNDVPAVTSHTVSQLAVERAGQRGITADKAAKEVRGLLRANFDTIVKLDPTILDVKSSHNDGTRWPALNDDVRTFVLDRKSRAELKARVA